MVEANQQTTSQRLIRSFGPTRILFGYLPTKEVIYLQACNRFLYDSGVSRSQTTILLYAPIFFWNPNSLEKLFILNPRSHQVLEKPVICENDAEFYKYYDWQWKSCQIGNRLYITGGS